MDRFVVCGLDGELVGQTGRRLLTALCLRVVRIAGSEVIICVLSHMCSHKADKPLLRLHACQTICVFYALISGTESDIFRLVARRITFGLMLLAVM